jgi:hypothetical protein
VQRSSTQQNPRLYSLKFITWELPTHTRYISRHHTPIFSLSVEHRFFFHNTIHSTFAILKSRALHRTLANMQIFRSAPVLLLLALSYSQPLVATAPKVHTVTLGAIRKVPYTPPDATPATKADESSTLKVRPLFVDDRQKEWTTGESHEVTDRSFTIRRALRLNDALPTDSAPHWIWQPGPWLLVDRTTGHITPLHLPDFDPAVSDVVWFRDYAAYCGIATTAKGGLFAIVAQLGARRPVVQRQIGPWPQPNHFIPVCQPAKWQRLPVRVTIQPTRGEPNTFDVVGTASLIEEGEEETN